MEEWFEGLPYQANLEWKRFGRPDFAQWTDSRLSMADLQRSTRDPSSSLPSAAAYVPVRGRFLASRTAGKHALLRPLAYGRFRSSAGNGRSGSGCPRFARAGAQDAIAS